MFRRLPLTLWLYVLADLWKLVALTTLVLVTVIAFAAAVKPLADGKLGPEDTLKFMLLAMVPMLQYALPFAACFGATLAYHRLATDNELTAVHAGGVSHKSMLVPAAISGLLLAGILLTLSNSIIPRFLRGMSELVAQDAAKIIVSAVQRGEALDMRNGTLIYADKVETLGPDIASGAYDTLWLKGLLVVRLNEKGEIESQGSANSASVWLRRTNIIRGPRGPVVSTDGKPMTEVIIKPTNPVGLQATVRAASADAVMSFTLPNAFGDNVKYLSFSELRQLREDPARIDRVNKSKRSLGQQLAECDVMARINDVLRKDGIARFTDPFKVAVTLKASGLRPTKRDGKRDGSVYQILPPATRDHRIVVDTTDSGGKVTHQFAVDGYVRLPSSPDPDRGGATVTLQLEQVAAAQAGPDGEVEAPDEPEAGRGELAVRPIPDLMFADDQAARILARSTTEIQQLAEKRMADKPGDRPVIAPSLATLQNDIRELLNEVLSKEQERYAMSVACLVMVLVGAVMAMRLREALPLTVYLWAFFPALATVLAISGGQQLTHGKGMVGLPVLWAGVAALTIFAAFEFIRLRRH